MKLLKQLCIEAEIKFKFLDSFFFILLFCCILLSCTFSSPYLLPDLPVPVTIPRIKPNKKVASEVINSKTLSKTFSISGWQNIFVDPILKDFIELALKNNRDLRHAMLIVSRLQAQYQIKQSSLSPYFSSSVHVGRTRAADNAIALDTPNISEQYSVGLGSSWEIDLFGELRFLKKQALMSYLGSIEGQHTATLSLIVSVAKQYLTWFASHAQMQIIESKLKISEKILRMQRILFEQGTVDHSVLIQYEELVQKFKIEKHICARNHAQARNMLMLLVGKDLPEVENVFEGLVFEKQNILLAVPVSLVSDCLLARPDVKYAKYQVQAANASIAAARAAFFPKISLTGSFGVVSGELTNLISGGNAGWHFLPRISMPIFNGGANRARLQLAKVDRDLAIVEYEKNIQQAFREVSDALAIRDTYEDQLNLVTKILNDKNNCLRLAKIRYRAGLESYFTVLNAELAFLQARQSYVEVKLSQLIALISLYQTLGIG